MLRISKLTDYAAMIMGYMALNSKEILSAAQLAKAMHLALPTVSKILKILSEAKLVASTRGTAGGYRLAKPAQEITVTDLIAAIEGNPALTECCAAETQCDLDAVCAIKENWQSVNRMILKALSSLTLSDMVQPMDKHPLTLRGIPVKVQGL